MTTTGALSALVQENIPSNKDLKEAIQQTQETLKNQCDYNTKLNEKGREMVKGADQLLEATKEIIDTRNQDELLQHFVQHAVEVGKKAKDAAAAHQGDAKEAWDKISNIAPLLKSLITEVFTSNEIQRLLIEIVQVFSSVFAKMDPDVIMKDSSKDTSSKKIDEEDKHQIAQKVTALHAKIGRNPKAKAFRQNCLQLWYYFGNKADNEKSELSLLRLEFQSLYNEGLSVLQRFVGSTYNLHQLSNRCVDLWYTIKNDPETTQFRRDWQDWSDSVVNAPDEDDLKGTQWAKSKQTSKAKWAEDLIEQGQHLIRDKYGDQLRTILDEGKAIIDQLQNDAKNAAWRQEFVNMRKAFTTGSLLDTLTQLRYLAGPILKDSLRLIPIPDVCDEDENTKYTLKNMKLDGRELSVDDICLNIKIGIKDLLEVRLTISNVYFEIKDCDFTYNRTSFPTFSDAGKCSAKIESGEWYFKWVVKEEGKTPCFSIENISCPFRNFDFHVDAAAHPNFDNLILVLFNSRIRNKTQQSIEENLKSYGDKLTAKLNDFFNSFAVIDRLSSESIQKSLPADISMKAPAYPYKQGFAAPFYQEASSIRQV